MNASNYNNFSDTNTTVNSDEIKQRLANMQNQQQENNDKYGANVFKKCLEYLEKLIGTAKRNIEKIDVYISKQVNEIKDDKFLDRKQRNVDLYIQGSRLIITVLKISKRAQRQAKKNSKISSDFILQSGLKSQESGKILCEIHSLSNMIYLNKIKFREYVEELNSKMIIQGETPDTQQYAWYNCNYYDYYGNDEKVSKNVQELNNTLNFYEKHIKSAEKELEILKKKYEELFNQHRSLHGII